jgi:hypothetical protein
MELKYFCGLTLGETLEPTAKAIIEREGAAHAGIFRVRHLDRWPLEASYPEIICDTVDLFEREPLRDKVRMAIDATTAGKPVVDLFKK